MRLDPEQCIVERADVTHAEVYDCFQSGYYWLLWQLLRQMRWPCRRSMSWKGCRCRRRRHARASADSSFLLVVSWQVSYICQLFKKKTGMPGKPSWMSWHPSGRFFSWKPKLLSQVTMKGKKSSTWGRCGPWRKVLQRCDLETCFWKTVVWWFHVLWKKKAFFWKDEMKLHLMKKTDTVYMKLLFVLLGKFRYQSFCTAWLSVEFLGDTRRRCESTPDRRCGENEVQHDSFVATLLSPKRSKSRLRW